MHSRANVHSSFKFTDILFRFMILTEVNNQYDFCWVPIVEMYQVQNERSS